MDKKILSEITRMKEIMGIISEQVVTDYDSTYDYKKEGNEYFAKRKNSNQWNKLSGKSLESVKTKVFKDNSTSSSSSSTTSNKTSSPFKNKEEGDKFRKWVNDNYPDYAKQISLDVSGSHTNSYIIKAAEKYGEEYVKSMANNQKNEPNPNLVVSDNIASKFNNIDFEDLSTQDSTHNVCVAGSENCAQFVNDLRDDLAYVGNAWNAYNNIRLGDTVYSSFDNLDEQTREEVINLWLKIHKKGGGKENGPFKNKVSQIVNRLVPKKGAITDLKVDDVVGLYYPSSSHHEEAFYQGGEEWFTEDSEGNKIPGDTIKNGKGWGMNTHIGTVGAIKDGVPLIFHNVTGDVISDPASNLRIAWVKRTGVAQSIINKVESNLRDFWNWLRT